MSVKVSPFGKDRNGRDIKLFTLTNAKGYTASFTDYGARLVVSEDVLFNYTTEAAMSDEICELLGSIIDEGKERSESLTENINEIDKQLIGLNNTIALADNHRRNVKNLESARDFTHVDDICEAIKIILESSKEWKNEVFDVGYGKSTTVNELINILKNNINPSYDKVVYGQEKPYDVKTTLANPNKLYEWFGFKPKYQLKEGLDKWLRAAF